MRISRSYKTKWNIKNIKICINCKSETGYGDYICYYCRSHIPSYISEEQYERYINEKTKKENKCVSSQIEG